MDTGNSWQSKKMWYVCGAVVALVILLYFLGVFQKRFQNPDEERKWRAGEEQKVAALIRAGDIAACDKVGYVAADGIKYKTVCSNNIALTNATQKLDYEWCKKLDDTLFSIADCERQVMFGKLAKEKNLAVCNSAPREDLKPQCVAGYWTEKTITDHNVALCENIPEKDSQTGCKDNYYIDALITKPASVSCDVFSPGLKNDCTQFKDAKTNTQKGFPLCRTILHPRLQMACERGGV